MKLLFARKASDHSIFNISTIGSMRFDFITSVKGLAAKRAFNAISHAIGWRDMLRYLNSF